MAGSTARPVARPTPTADAGVTNASHENRLNDPDLDSALNAAWPMDRTPASAKRDRARRATVKVFEEGHPVKHGIHPVSRPVIFRDRATGFQMLTRSTIETEQTMKWEDGVTYPLVDVEISSASHPFYTGSSRVVDTEGRVERFERRYSTGTAHH